MSWRPGVQRVSCHLLSLRHGERTARVRQPLRPWLSLQRLKAAVHYTVGCLCQEVAVDKQMQFSKQTIAAISEVTFQQCGRRPLPFPKGFAWGPVWWKLWQVSRPHTTPSHNLPRHLMAVQFGCCGEGPSGDVGTVFKAPVSGTLTVSISVLCETPLLSCVCVTAEPVALALA